MGALVHHPLSLCVTDQFLTSSLLSPWHHVIQYPTQVMGTMATVNTYKYTIATMSNEEMGKLKLRSKYFWIQNNIIHLITEICNSTFCFGGENCLTHKELFSQHKPCHYYMVLHISHLVSDKTQLWYTRWARMWSVNAKVLKLLSNPSIFWGYINNRRCYTSNNQCYS